MSANPQQDTDHRGDPDVAAHGEPPLVVGIGGSAGGLQAVMTLLEALGGEVPLAIVVVLHLAPDHESSAVEILQRVTPLSVSQVKGRTLLRAGHVYVIAPGMNLITEDGHVQAGEASTKRPSTVIDLFFRSLGRVHRERAVSIVLSGTGRDGSLGMSQVKECGGLTIAQAPDECEHADMPQAAIATGSVDLVLPVAEMGKRLVELAKFPRSPVPLAEAGVAGQPSPDVEPRDGSDERAFRDILAMLRTRTGHDFRNYKLATVTRRLERRMQVTGYSSLQAYRDHVLKFPEELPPLLADMLISVTNFFRDTKAFEALQRDVVAPMMEALPAGEEFRVWVAACASGEESYSMAILLQEYAERMTQPPQVQIFATDINEAALSVARAGLYPGNISADVSDSRLLGYFEKEEGGHYRVRPTLRKMIVFAPHNLLADPPFSRLDLICCRNLLIYLDRSAQAAVFDLFAYALKPGGHLFLGSAESMDPSNATFETVSREHRIYRLRAGAGMAARIQVSANRISASTSPPPAAVRGSRPHPVEEQPLATQHERALMAISPPSVLVNAAQEIERVSQGAGRYVAFGEGVPTRQLLSNVPADIRLELRTALFRAGQSQRSVQSVFRRVVDDGRDGQAMMTLSVHPVEGNAGDPMRWLVVFDETAIGGADRPDEEPGTQNGLQATVNRLEDENRELKAQLQDTLDRAAVSNEEIRASNEELQAINEELRSAKEELETSKEELQSVNEELTTVNFELRLKVDEAGRHNDDLRNLIEASDIATIFVDQAMRVNRFTPPASKLFALIPSDVGRPLLDVKSRLNYDEMVEDATRVFKHLRPVERHVTSVEDEHFLARILPYRTSLDKIGGAVLTFINVTELRRAQGQVRLSEERLRDSIAASNDFAVMSTDAAGHIVTWNEGAALMFGYSPDEIMGQMIDVLFTREDRMAGIPEQERSDARHTGRATDERWHVRRDGSAIYCSGIMAPLHEGGHAGFLKIARDVSESKILEAKQQHDLSTERHKSASAKDASELKDRFLAVMSHELKQPLNLIHVNAELLVRLPEVRGVPVVQRIGDTILRAVQAQETIVNDLLDLSRIQTGKLRLHVEATDLVKIVQQFCRAIAADASGKNITLEVQTPQWLICHCDPVRIEQVVWNLLGNAIKFTPAGGKIRVTLAEERSAVRFQVADTGVGIPKESLPSLFELFRQGPAAETAGGRRSGMGIGLALVRELVQAHGGRVEATSPGKGQGSTFTVRIPMRTREALDPAAVAGPVVPLDLRILMVDDDVETLTGFAALLKLEGATVDTTTAARQALEKLAAGDYDLLLSDIGMPGMSGLELMERARELRPAKRFRSVAISGYGREADVRAALAAGFDAHLSKPISLERLRSTLDRL